MHEIIDAARGPQESGGAKAVSIAMVAGLLKRVAPEDQRKALDLTAAYAEAHPETKAYVKQLIDQAYVGTTQTVNAIDRLRQEHALETERDHLQAQLRNGGSRGVRDALLAGGRALVINGSVAAATELAQPDLPREKVPGRLKEIDDQLAQIQAERQVNRFLDDRLNPNRPPDGGVWGLFEQAGIDTADQTHVLLLTALGPAGGVGAIEAMGARSADQLKARYPRMSTDTAHVLGVGMAAGQFVLGKLEFLKVLNKFPGTKRLLERVGKMSYWRQLAAREGINLLGATATNELSLLIDSFGQEVANAITGDIQDGHEPGSFVETQKHVLALSGMLGLGGIGSRLTKEAARLLNPQIRKAVGGIVRQALSRLVSRKKTQGGETSVSQPTQEHALGAEISHEEGDPSERKGFVTRFREDWAAKRELRKSPPVHAPFRSDPISGSVDISRVDRKTVLVFKRIFPALDKVLNGRGFPKIFVDNVVPGDPKGTFEATVYKTPEGDRYVPKRIGIKSNGPWMHMTGLHEVAHPIDMEMMGKGKGYASDTSPKFEAWRKLVDATPTIKKMRLDKETYKKFLPYPEIFARSFAQYVAMRTGDRAILREVETIRRHKKESFKVWLDQEFWPIAAELDRILNAEGLK